MRTMMIDEALREDRALREMVEHRFEKFDRILRSCRERFPGFSDAQLLLTLDIICADRRAELVVDALDKLGKICHVLETIEHEWVKRHPWIDE